ncbi:probable inactive poly [ADP-ribose] polymerase SRO2 [Lotus japonicus]|uniref:probable inactive poly [ADP-ribose] polymerase SRO2 n=1 Tax=Lotus japonicus TaxID=34305 RepID=UPI0025858F54|nr:probable inactive poly [ADP-ribose] polymerase SRO2 [Lotus japonicus]
MDPHAAAAANEAAYAAAAAAADDSDSDTGSSIIEGEYLVRQDGRSMESIRGRFMAGLGFLAENIQVVSIKRNTFPTVMTQARIDAFEIYARATARARDGDANVEHAWFGALDMDEIMDIVRHGFSKDQLHGHGLRLSPEDSPILCMGRTCTDNDGLKHLLLCRVILGRMAVVAPGSECEPISEEYDTAVHDVSSFKEIFILSNNMNTHVLPEYVLSFRVLPRTTGPWNMAERPIAPSVPIGTFIMALSRILPLNDMALISKSHHEFNENIISGEVLMQRLREIAGESLLMEVMSCFH